MRKATVIAGVIAAILTLGACEDVDGDIDLPRKTKTVKPGKAKTIKPGKIPVQKGPKRK